MKALAMALLLNASILGTAWAAKADTASATDTTPAKEELQPAAKHFDFEDDQVEGDIQRPDGFLITAIQEAKHKSLIDIRTNFVPEMIKSMEDL
jgi:hypothetical protein